MSVTAQNPCNTVAQGAPVGGVSWTSSATGVPVPADLVARDAQYSTFIVGTTSFGLSPYIYARNFGFTNTDIPVGSTINGIEVTINTGDSTGASPRNKKLGPSSASGGSTLSNLDTVQLCQTVTLVGNNKASGASLPIGDTVYGGSMDVWGWGAATQANLTNASFGVAIRVNMQQVGSADIDYIGVRVFFTPPGAVPGARYETIKYVGAAGLAIKCNGSF